MKVSPNTYNEDAFSQTEGLENLLTWHPLNSDTPRAQPYKDFETPATTWLYAIQSVQQSTHFLTESGTQQGLTPSKPPPS